MYFVQLRIAPQNPKTPICVMLNYFLLQFKLFNNKSNSKYILIQIKIIIICICLLEDIMHRQLTLAIKVFFKYDAVVFCLLPCKAMVHRIVLKRIV